MRVTTSSTYYLARASLPTEDVLTALFSDFPPILRYENALAMSFLSSSWVSAFAVLDDSTTPAPFTLG